MLQVFEISRPVRIPQQQYLIYWKWHQHTYRKSKDRLTTTWKSNLFDERKQELLLAVAVSELLYCCTNCILTKGLDEKLDVNYTRMFWTHPGGSILQKQQLYGQLSLISKITQERWSRYVGTTRHCWWNKDERISNVLLWTPTRGHTSFSWPAKYSYLSVPCKNWIPSRRVTKSDVIFLIFASDNRLLSSFLFFVKIPLKQDMQIS